MADRKARTLTIGQVQKLRGGCEHLWWQLYPKRSVTASSGRVVLHPSAYVVDRKASVERQKARHHGD
jgi:hypothetical protein